jgi:triphosphoribosyl-dephospho-CoA synthase
MAAALQSHLLALHYVRYRARELLREGGVVAPGGVGRMEAFDDALIGCHLVPGGSADLLAITWFLAQFPSGQR